MSCQQHDALKTVLVVHLQEVLEQDAKGAKRTAKAILSHMEYTLQQWL